MEISTSSSVLCPSGLGLKVDGVDWTSIGIEENL